jgi:hypothetical protein
MNFLITTARFFQEAEKKELYRYFILFMAGILLGIGLFLYWYWGKVGNLKDNLKSTNQARLETRRILQQHALVMQQQDEVNTILEKDKDFLILDYFNTLLSSLHLEVYNSKPAQVTEENLNNGYIEEKLDAGFTNMNMQQLCQLLDKIERNERIYTKELNITKALKSPTIDVTLTIATLALEKKAGT